MTALPSGLPVAMVKGIVEAHLDHIALADQNPAVDLVRFPAWAWGRHRADATTPEPASEMLTGS